MKKILIAFGHDLTEDQLSALAEMALEPVLLKDTNPDLQRLVSAFPADADLDAVKRTAVQVVAEAAKIGATHILVVGEYAVFYWTVTLAAQVGITPIQSTTERATKDVKNADGSVTSTRIFRHVQFRPLV